MSKLATLRQEIFKSYLLGQTTHTQFMTALVQLEDAPAKAAAPVKPAADDRQAWVDKAREQYQAREKARLARFRATKARKLARAEAKSQARAKAKPAKAKPAKAAPAPAAKAAPDVSRITAALDHLRSLLA